MQMAAMGPLVAARAPLLGGEAALGVSAADHVLRIKTGLVELAPDHIVSTTLYNDQFPGPLLRMEEGRPVVIDIHNETDVPELVHWHGQAIPSNVDGAAEEGTPYVAPHGIQRLSFTPRPSGFRFYHSHAVAGPDLARGTYTGQLGSLCAGGILVGERRQSRVFAVMPSLWGMN